MLFHDKAYPRKPEARSKKNRRVSSPQAAALPAWQRERANRLHRKFLSVEAAMQRGVRFNDAVKVFVWYHRGNHFLTNPAKKVLFSRGTLRCHFIHWRKHGRVPEVLYLRYNAGRSALPASRLCRFIEFCGQMIHPSLRSALRKFRRAEGLTRAKGRPQFNYFAVARYFPARDFSALQKQIAVRAAAESELARLKAQIVAGIRRHLPADDWEREAR